MQIGGARIGKVCETAAATVVSKLDAWTMPNGFIAGTEAANDCAVTARSENDVNQPPCLLNPNRLNHIKAALPTGAAARPPHQRSDRRAQFAFQNPLAVPLLYLCALAGAAAHSIALARVMLVGMFHFANPGLDMVKSRATNVMSPTNRAYLDGLGAWLATFCPTDVLAEFSRFDQGKVNEKFCEYVDGRFELPANETYQTGFQVDKPAKLSAMTCFDNDVFRRNSQPMFERKWGQLMLTSLARNTTP